MGTNFFNGTEAELNTGASNFAMKISATPIVYGLTAPQASLFTSVSDLYTTTYLAALDPATRTKSAIAAKNNAKKDVKAMASNLAQIVDATPSVTDQQKIDLGLNVRKTPSPIPVPTDRPGVDLLSVAARTVKIRIHNADSQTKRGKPAGTAAAWVYSYVGAEYPTDPGRWTFQGSVSKNVYDVVFPDTVASGAQVWICAAWINSKQESGPVSLPITTNVQIGGVSSSASMKMAA